LQSASPRRRALAMQPTAPLVTVVCPAFEEAEGLPAFHGRLTACLDRLAGEYRFEVLYVDDGSADDTLAVLRQVAQADSRVCYLSFSRNFGKEAAMAAGLEHARGGAVLVMDTDLQHPPELVPALLARWREGNDIVFTRRKETQPVGAYRRYVVGT